MKATDEIVKASKLLVIGSRPSHVHGCGCECNSPYCGPECNQIPCENHGGPPNIVQGFEPWRGR